MANKFDLRETLGKLNPFRPRVDFSQGQTLVPAGTGGFNFQACVNGMLNNPNISDGDIVLLMGSDSGKNGGDLPPETRRDYIEAVRTEARRRALLTGRAHNPTSPQAQAPTNASPSSQLQQNELDLVNYSPEQLIKQVHESLSAISFGATRGARFMDKYSDIWALVGPIILLAGTIGEVFIVLWLRQKDQNVLAGLSIVAVALVLEGTFLAVSYRAAMIRSRMNQKPANLARVDRRKLFTHLLFWFALACGVCATQVIFIAAQTNDTGIGTAGVWAFAILRAVFTLVADGYTAFAHEEGPTTSELALQAQEERTKGAEAFLQQKRREVQIINAGTLEVRAATIDAEIREDEERTRLKIKQLENMAHIDMMKQNHEQNLLFTNLQNNVMRAFFDPTVSLEHRERVLNLMSGLMDASKHLPAGKTKVTEEKDM